MTTSLIHMEAKKYGSVVVEHKNASESSVGLIKTQVSKPYPPRALDSVDLGRHKNLHSIKSPDDADTTSPRSTFHYLLTV